MRDVIPLLLLAIAATGLVAAVAAALHVRSLRLQLDALLARAPRDESGLGHGDALVPRLGAELTRARRSGGAVWLAVLTVTRGDGSRFARIAANALRVPESGFRLGDAVVAVVRPDVDPSSREDVLGRLVAAAPRARLVVSEASWSVGDADVAPEELLRTAIGDAGTDLGTAPS